MADEFTLKDFEDEFNESDFEESLPQFIGSQFGRAVEKTRTEGIGPITGGINIALGGLPKAGLEKVRPRAAEAIFPKAETFTGKVAEGAFGIAGFLRGVAVKAGSHLSKLILPKITTPTLKGISPAAQTARTLGRDAIKFGTAGALQTPENEQGDFIAPRQRAFQATLGATAGPIGFGAGRLISKGAKGVSNLAGAIKNSIDRNGASITQPDFVRTTLAPKLNNLFQSSLQKFDDNFQKFAIRKMRVPKEQVEHIANRGTNVVTQATSQSGGNVQGVLSTADDALASQQKAVDSLYENSLNSIQANVNPRSALAFAKNKLTALRFRTLQGERTDLAKSISRNKALGVLDDFFEQNRVTGIQTRATATPADINKEQFIFWRDSISKSMRGASDSERRILKQFSDAFHKDAERSGFKGIIDARDNFANLQNTISLRDKVTEQQLNKAFKLTKAQANNISQLEKKLGIELLNPSKDIVSGRTLEQKLLTQKLDDAVLGESEFFAKQLDQGLDKAKTGTIKQGLKDLLGSDDAVNQIITDLESFRFLQTGKRRALQGGAAVGGALALRKFGLLGGGFGGQDQ